jgi:hypothetical protein
MSDDMPGRAGEHHERSENYQKVPAYEAALEQFNRQLTDLEPPGAETPDEPVTFVVGVPRSGTTLLYQVLAASGAFGYCSNVVARFFRAPWAGARVQRILEPVLDPPNFTYESDAGRTDGWAGPHEFGYFWEEHFGFEAHHEPTDDALDALDPGPFRRDLAALEAELDAPLLFKNVILDFVVERIDAWLEDARFLCLQRDPMLVAQSLYRTRRSYYGTPEAWYSVRPRRADDWEERSPAEQIAAQIRSVSESLNAASKAIDEAKWRDVSYRELCEAPRDLAESVAGARDVEATELDRIPASFVPSTELTLDADVLERLERALEDEGVST